MVEIKYTQDINAPFFICDVCGQRIENIKLGAAVYHGWLKNGETSEVKHVHKGECFLMMESIWKHQGIETASDELITHLIYLLHNSGLKLSDLSEWDDK